MRTRWKSARPLMRWLAAGGLVLLVAGIGTGTWWVTHREAATAATVPTTRTVAASLTTLQQSVSAEGTLTPAVQEEASFAVGGTVTSVLVASGDTVTVGQPLATVGTLELDADRLSAVATLARAEATLADAQDAADGTDASDATIAAARAQVDVAQAAVDEATAAVSDATLTAPVAGLLTTVDLAVGDVVAGSGGSSGGSTSSAGTGAPSSTASGTAAGTASTTTGPFVIVGTDAWTVSVSVGEADIEDVAVGQQVELTSDSLDETVYGTVASIGLLSTSTSGVAAYPVRVDVTGSPAGLHDGIAVTAQIIWSRRTEVLTVPSQAVTTADDGTTTVTQLDGDEAEVSVPVETGETSGDVIEIVSGLTEGDEVVVQVFTPRAAGTDAGTGGRQGAGTGQEGFPGGTGQMPDFGSGGMPQRPGQDG